MLRRFSLWVPCLNTALYIHLPIDLSAPQNLNHLCAEMYGVIFGTPKRRSRGGEGPNRAVFRSGVVSQRIYTIAYYACKGGNY